MRQSAQLTLSAPTPEGTTMVSYRHLLEEHLLARGILEIIDDFFSTKVSHCASGRWSMPSSPPSLFDQKHA
ncbi:hypothetical protein KH389_16155 [Pseudomonas qingdaonensis]|uniref:Transposase n=1 Tax=Pseudomonas qingdaonensis TaxID=2056231 RepID=A0ABX8DLM4_9PSED|nr:hypothetical protein KH389_16155 [Pseudomonas qingdaonensis]